MANVTPALPSGAMVPALVASAGERAGVCFVEFFASAIRNPHTRRAYARAASDFLTWCADAGVSSITAVQPLHVASWVELQTRTHAASTVKQRLAAIRHLFDWLVTGQVVPVNSAASVRSPSHTVRTCATPVLDPAEARQLLDSIDVSTPIGLRDRALIALMVFRSRGSARRLRCGSMTYMCSNDGFGYACAKKVTRHMRCRATTHLRWPCALI